MKHIIYSKNPVTLQVWVLKCPLMWLTAYILKSKTYKEWWETESLSGRNRIAPLQSLRTQQLGFKQAQHRYDW